MGGRDQYSFKKPNPNIKNMTETNSEPASSGSTASPSTNKKKTNVMHKNRMPSVFKFGLSTKVTKTKEEKIRERYEREALRKKHKLENFIINIDDDDIDFGGLGVGGDTVEDGENVPLLVFPPSDYRIARCFLSNNLTSPADDSEKVCWGENLLGADVLYKDLEDPDGYYKALGCKKMSSDEDIGVALKKPKKGFFGLDRTHHPEKTE